MRKLSDDITLYDYPLGDQVRILRSIEATAERLGQADVRERAAAALEVAEAAADARARRALEDGQRAWTPRATELDRAIDAHVAYLHAILSTLAARTAHPQVEAARRALASQFPAGLRRFTQARFAEQAILNHGLVEHLRGEGAALVAAMGLTEAVDALAAQAAAFSVELNVAARRTTPEQVAQAEEAALEETLALIHHVMGRWRPSDAAACAVRDELLLPVVQVNEALHERYQARQRGRAASRVA